MIEDITTEREYEKALELSVTKPVFILKHSTVCSISANAWMEFNRFAENKMDVVFRRVLVRENRDISMLIADKTDIRHESPQVILIKKGIPVWNASHYGISEKSLMDALEID